MIWEKQEREKRGSGEERGSNATGLNSFSYGNIGENNSGNCIFLLKESLLFWASVQVHHGATMISYRLL